MRRADLIPLVLIGGIVAFIAAQSMKTRAPRKPQAQAEPTVESPPRSAAARPQGESTAGDTLVAAPAEPNPLEGMVEIRMSSSPPPRRDDESIRSTLEAYAERTYLNAMLGQQGRLLMRWPARELNSLRVWIDRNPEVAGWDRNYLVVAEGVFDEWREAGFPLSFDFVHDTTGSDIRILWTTQLASAAERRIGTTVKTRDQHGWIVEADITIALQDNQGRLLPPALVAGIVRHEVGHALGLGHSESPADVMFPESRTPVISAADRTTLNVLYRLPPGIVK